MADILQIGPVEEIYSPEELLEDIRKEASSIKSLILMVEYEDGTMEPLYSNIDTATFVVMAKLLELESSAYLLRSKVDLSEE